MNYEIMKKAILSQIAVDLDNNKYMLMDMFGESLDIKFDGDKDYSLSIPVVINGKPGTIMTSTPLDEIEGVQIVHNDDVI